MTSPLRPGGRAVDELRPVSIEIGVMKYAEGSALIDLGDTRVLVSASIEKQVPAFLRDKGQGWLTAEYSMLPRATVTRNTREVTRGKPSGRTAEIQRLIGRSLRAAIDLGRLGERTLTVDCDVLQADGGTRTAAVTAAYVAVVHACARLLLLGDLERWPIVEQIAAVSVGRVQGRAVLDLEYAEDQVAEVDLNVVTTGGGGLVELQGTAEGRPFDRGQLDEMLDLAGVGLERLRAAQDAALAAVLAEVEAVGDRSGRRKREVTPRSESELWGRPKR